MAEPRQPAGVYRFGSYEADVANRQLRRDGLNVRLQGQPFDILALLLEHAGNLVTREQLRARLWSASTVVEFDHSVHTAVTKLREALGDDADNPRFVATVPRHGYRFIAPVAGPALITPDAPGEPAPRVAQDAAPRAARRSLSLPSVVAVPARLFLGITAILVLGLAYLLVDDFRLSQRVRTSAPTTTDAIAAKSRAAASAPENSIAVLPFVDMSEKQDQDYFSDGMTEELIDHLAQAPGLKVIARTSSFRFKGRRDDARAIASMLGVAHLVAGSVRTSGNSLRITVELIRASDGSHVWSHTYDRTLDDAFKVQSEIARAVAQSLKVGLKMESGHADPGTSSADAYSLVLKGNFFVSRFERDDVPKAIELYREAIQIDPTYAQAWARLADAYVKAQVRWMPRADAIANARAAAQRSLQLDPNLVMGHFVLARIYMRNDHNWPEAQAEIDRMREIDAGNGRQLPLATAALATTFGRLDEAIEIYERMLERDPLDTSILEEVARNYFDSNRKEKAAEALQRVIELNPTFPGCQACLSISLVLLGRTQQALAAIANEHDDVGKAYAAPIVYWVAGRRAESDAALEALKTRFGDSLGYSIASAYAARGDPDAAFEWLDRAYEQRDPDLLDVKTDGVLINLRRDARFRALLVKLKIDGDKPVLGH